MWKSLLIVLVFLSGCSLFVPEYSKIQDAEKRWNAQNIENYTFTRTLLCFCIQPNTIRVVVRNNKVVQALNPETNAPFEPPTTVNLEWLRTIDVLFAQLNEIQANNPEIFEVSYHPKYGYPTNINVDMSFQIADEEWSMTITDFQIDE